MLALASKLIWWWPETDRRQDQGFSLCGYPEMRMNDGRADPLGAFWVGTMGNNIAADGTPIELPDRYGELLKTGPTHAFELCGDIRIPNTLCWNAEDLFYFGDSIANRIYVHRHDSASGDIDNGRTSLDGFERGLPNGSAIDQEGCLWNCRYAGGCIAKVAPDGEILSVIEMPVTNPTSCTFGGDDLRTLFVTSAAAPAGQSNSMGHPTGLVSAVMRWSRPPWPCFTREP